MVKVFTAPNTSKEQMTPFRSYNPNKKFKVISGGITEDWGWGYTASGGILSYTCPQGYIFVAKGMILELSGNLHYSTLGAGQRIDAWYSTMLTHTQGTILSKTISLQATNDEQAINNSGVTALPLDIILMGGESLSLSRTMGYIQPFYATTCVAKAWLTCSIWGYEIPKEFEDYY